MNATRRIVCALLQSNESLKSLMLGLIYPAILGTFLYDGISITLGSRIAVWTGHRATILAVTDSGLKAWLLGVTVLFYGADYLYITYTRAFSVLFFFFFDLVFLGLLYGTVFAIDLKPGSVSPPNLPMTVGCFFGFMAMYLVWDLIEWSRPGNADERCWYRKVLAWEMLSLLGLAATWWWGRGTSFERRIVPVLLSAITAYFLVLSFEKRRFVKLSQSDSS